MTKSPLTSGNLYIKLFILPIYKMVCFECGFFTILQQNLTIMLMVACLIPKRVYTDLSVQDKEGVRHGKRPNHVLAGSLGTCCNGNVYYL